MKDLPPALPRFCPPIVVLPLAVPLCYANSLHNPFLTGLALPATAAVALFFLSNQGAPQGARR